MNHRLKLAGIVLFIVLAFSCATNDVYAEKAIREGVYVDDMDLSGMTTTQAQEIVAERVKELGEYIMHIKVGTEFVPLTCKELGLTWSNSDVVDEAANIGHSGNIVQRYKILKDLEKEPYSFKLIMEIDRDVLRNTLQEKCIPIQRKPVNASLSREDGEFKIIDGQTGIEVDVEKSIETIANYLCNEWDGGESTIALNVTVTEPAGTSESLALVQDVLGEYSTDYSTGTDGRNINVELGTAKVDGHTIYPGEELSVIECMLPFTEEAGWTQAHAYENGLIVDSIGGGICQVSSTLYNAILRAEIEVTERSNHSMTVKYVPLSMDAAISEGVKDLKILNNTDAPIYIEGYAGGGTCSFVIWGHETRSENRSIEFDTIISSATEGGSDLVSDPEAAVGSVEYVQDAYTGYSCELWKIVTENGETTREQVNSSTYIPAGSTYAVGTKGADSSTLDALWTAISTNNVNNVYSVLGGGSATAYRSLKEVGDSYETTEDGSRKYDSAVSDESDDSDDEY